LSETQVAAPGGASLYGAVSSARLTTSGADLAGAVSVQGIAVLTGATLRPAVRRTVRACSLTVAAHHTGVWCSAIVEGVEGVTFCADLLVGIIQKTRFAT